MQIGSHRPNYDIQWQLVRTGLRLNLTQEATLLGRLAVGYTPVDDRPVKEQ